MKRFLMILLAGFTLAGCNTIDLNQIMEMTSSLDDAFSDTSEEEEQLAGREAAAVLLGAAPLLENDALNNYVNRVGRWVALHSDRPDLQWRFAVLDDPDINAFAAPGGYIFITSGLLARMRSEAELAGVLGHEIVHVTEKHHLEAMQKQARMKLVGFVASSALQEEGYDPTQVAGLVNAARNLYSKGLDRKDEYQADRIGVVLAARAGYDPYGLPAVLQTLDRINPDSSSLALLNATHPRPADRLQRLDEAMMAADGLSDGQAGADRFQAMLAALAQQAGR